MPPVRRAKLDPDPVVNITAFVEDCERLLPPNAPLLKVLARTPRTMRISELRIRLDTFLPLLEA